MKTTRWGSAFGGVVTTALLCSGCPDGVGATDGGGEPPTDALPDVAMDDLADVAAEPDDGMDDGGRDAVDDPHDAADRMDAPRDDGGTDAMVPGCIPGMSVVCACTDGRMGAQVCRADGTFADCRCTTTDAATDAPLPDVALPLLGPRLITPQSVSRVTSRRPTMRWVLPAGVTRARVELCGDRACTRMLQQQEVTGTSWRPAAMLAPGVVFWRVRGLAGDGSVAWTSATWEYLVGRRDAPTDTSFGTLKDFNNDGYDDAASLGNYGPSGAHVSMMHGRSEQGAQMPTYELSIEDHEGRLLTGDFNGDGIADLVIPNGTQGSSFAPAGTIQVYHGRSGRLSTSPDWRFQVRPVLVERQVWHFAVAVGDFDGDGFSDLALLDSGLLEPMGRSTLRLFRGSLTGLAVSQSRSEVLPDAFDVYGRTMTGFAGLGDVNLDGHADLLATYPSRARIDRPEMRDIGRAWVVLGGPAFPSALWTPIDPPTRDLRFGFVAAAIGDVNGDQHADFAISSNHVVSVYLGASGAVPARHLRTLTSPSGQCYFPEASFGSSLGNAGDYNGDGRADLSVGAYCLPYVGGLRPGVGSAFVYNGTSEGVADNPSILTGMYPDTWFGFYLGGFGDFNADGFDDFSVFENADGRFDGVYRLPPLWIYHGSSTGIRPDTTRWFFRESIGAFSAPVAVCGALSDSTRGA